jgi:hypothetical protein
MPSLFRADRKAHLAVTADNRSLFFGMAKESDEGDAGVQSIGGAIVDVTPGDYVELVARQTYGSAKNVAADELTWLAIEVVDDSSGGRSIRELES